LIKAIFEIEGGRSLEGEINISGAKNAALPLLAAACLGEEPTTLQNMPVQLNDVQVLIQLFQAMGASIDVDGDTVRCERGQANGGNVPAELAYHVRYSLLLLGYFAALRQTVFLPLPGGCHIGERKHDLHVMGLRALGANVDELKNGILLKSDQLAGAHIDFYLPTTSGTENIMLAAILAKGTTIIRNANTRPEVQQMGQLLAAMGADITVQNRIIEVNGVQRLQGGATLSVMAGWDEAVTYIIAAGLTRGEIAIHNFDLTHIKEDTRYIREAGIKLFEWRDNVYVSAKDIEIRPFELFTAPYPGVNSDMQPIFAALALTIPGTSVITDLRFTDRFDYVEQLKLFQGDIEAFGNTAIVRGGKALIGTQVRATDLRGGAACVLCGLAAEGTTFIDNIFQIERGYECMAEKLTGLGASIRRRET